MTRVLELIRRGISLRRYLFGLRPLLTPKQGGIMSNYGLTTCYNQCTVRYSLIQGC